MRTTKSRYFWPVLLALFLTDCSTKRLAVEHLTPPYVPHDVAGTFLRFTLAYNPGAAFSIYLGPASRVTFTLLAFVALFVLGRLYRATRPDDVWQSLALALVCGGAAGNLLDRLTSPRGVVDFIDIGIGDVRWWTFNVADVGVTVGASLLAIVLWYRAREEQSSRDTLPEEVR
jgi:signal peptidase II